MVLMRLLPTAVGTSSSRAGYAHSSARATSRDTRRSVEVRSAAAATEPSQQLRTAAVRSSIEQRGVLEQLFAVDVHAPVSGLEAQQQSTASSSGLPAELYALQDPASPVALPAPGRLPLDNWKLDKLVAGLGRSRATWRRALVLYEWLKECGHEMDDRLCTTLIRVCSDHGDAVTALSVYEWMKAPRSAGGAALTPTTYTYTAAMRAAQGAGLLERAMDVWADARRAKVALDCRLCMTFIEICSRMNLTDLALETYAEMRAAPAGSRLSPTVHAYTAAMRAATEGGSWLKAMDIWEDMQRAGCQPTGHAFAAAISACAAGADWLRAVALFEEMTTAGIRPDVVSCTALVTALASAGECDKAEGVVQWMLSNGLKPNVRTYTALLTALCNALQWERAVETLDRMQQPRWGGVQPNAYSYSALLKSLGEYGQWQLAEAVFSRVEASVLSSVSHISSSNGVSSSGRATAPPPPPPPPRRAAGVSNVVPLSVAPVHATHAFSVASDVSPAASTYSTSSASSPVSGASSQQQLLTQAQLDSLTLAAASSFFLPSAEAGLLQPAAIITAPTAANADASQHHSLSASGLSRRSPSSSASASATARSQWTAAAELHGLSLDLPQRRALMPVIGESAVVESPQSPLPYFGGDNELFSVPAIPVESLDLGSPVTSMNSDAAGAAVSQQVALKALDGADGFSLFSGHGSSAINGAAHLSAAVAQSSVNGHHSSPWSLTMAQMTLQLLTSQQHSAVAVEPVAVEPELMTVSSSTAMTSSSTRGAATNHGGSASVTASPTNVVNEVVCGALMLAYERAGKWHEAVSVLGRALALGIAPNTVMYNTAISAAGKAGQLELVARLFAKVRAPDVVTYETVIAAYGMAGAPAQAEATFSTMLSAGFRPRDYAYCGLIAAHSLAGDPETAMHVRVRMKRDRIPATVYVYNALLAAAERAGMYEKALQLHASMCRSGVTPNAVTAQLMTNIGRQGVASVENAQVVTAALSAAFAAAGTLLLQTGAF